MEQVTVCVLPMYHIFAMNVTMSNMLWQGGKTITVPMFEPNMFLKTLLDYRPTTLHLAPPLVAFLANHPAVTADHLASLKTVRMSNPSNYLSTTFPVDSCWCCPSRSGSYRFVSQESFSCQARYTWPAPQVLKLDTFRFREGYGMTEMSPAVTFTRITTEKTGGSTGQLLPNTR